MSGVNKILDLKKRKRIKYNNKNMPINIKLLILLLVFFAITPNLGFFTLPSFLIITFIILCIIFSFLKNINYLGRKNNSTLLEFCFIILLFYSGLYYGGLYQEKESVLIGKVIFFLLLFFLFIKTYFLEKKVRISLLLVLTFYIGLGVWTIINSPKPTVDTFMILKEAPIKFIKGENPYSSIYTQVYQNTPLDYFTYLPFSFIYTLPFVVIFLDPRYGIIFANVLSAFIFYKIFGGKDRKIVLLSISAFLFLPGSFFILEHMYLDPIIFLFFLLFVYFYKVKRNSLSLISLSLFFLIKQHLLLLFPFYVRDKFSFNFFKPKNLVLFIFPFFLPLYFFILNKQAFTKNMIFNLGPNSSISPILSSSLTFQTFLKNYILINDYSLALFLGLFMFLIFYFFIIKNKITLVSKIVVFLFFFNFFTYHAFFNNYYLVAQFLLLDIVLDYFNISVE